MDLFAQDNYKHAIRGLAKTRRVTFRRLAEGLGIQYTYLSKILNQDKGHLSEDQLFATCELLELTPDEIDFLFLLRGVAVSLQPSRQKYLTDKLNFYRRKKSLDLPMEEYRGPANTSEMNYLFDPYGVVIHAALHVPEYREHPRRLCSLMGITAGQLTETLKRLRDLNFIELDSRQNVVRVLRTKLHYGTTHPLMRAHQQIMRTLGQAQLLRTAEYDKRDFITTFCATPETFQLLWERFQTYLKDAEPLVAQAKSEQVFQLHFTLFRWL